MLVKTEGIILKTTKFKETSLIVKAYTQSHGVLSFIVNGVRTEKNSNKAVLFQALNFLDLIVYYKENKNLLRLKEYKFNTLYQELPFNIVKSSIALLMLEVIEHTLNEEEENEELYEFIKNSFLRLDLVQKGIANFHLYFLLEFMYYKGIQAQGKFSFETPYFNIQEGCFTNDSYLNGNLDAKLSEKLSKLLHKEEINLNKTSRKQLLEKIFLYYRIHIDGFRKIKSLDILETVLE